MKGYRVDIPKDRIVIITQHVRNVKTSNDNKNTQLSRFLKRVVDQEELDDMGETRKRDRDIFEQKKKALKSSNRKQSLLSRRRVIDISSGQDTTPRLILLKIRTSEVSSMPCVNWTRRTTVQQ